MTDNVKRRGRAPIRRPLDLGRKRSWFPHTIYSDMQHHLSYDACFFPRHKACHRVSSTQSSCGRRENDETNRFQQAKTKCDSRQRVDLAPAIAAPQAPRNPCYRCTHQNPQKTDTPAVPPRPSAKISHYEARAPYIISTEQRASFPLTTSSIPTKPRTVVFTRSERASLNANQRKASLFTPYPFTPTESPVPF